MFVKDNKLKELHRDAITFVRNFNGVVVDAGVKCGDIELTHVGFFQPANIKTKPLLVGLVDQVSHPVRTLKVERVDRVVDNVYLAKKVIGGNLGNPSLAMEERLVLYNEAGESDPALGKFLELFPIKDSEGESCNT